MKAKFLAAALLLTAVVLIVSAASRQARAESSSSKPFISEKDGYVMHLPAGWKTKPDPIVNLVAAPGELIEEANPLPNLKVVVRPMRDGMTLDQICDLSQRQWAGAWKVDSDKHLTVDGRPTRRLVLSQDVKVLQTKVLKSFIEAHGNYYIISCSDKPENFAKSESIFNSILDSIRFSKPAQSKN